MNKKFLMDKNNKLFLKTLFCIIGILIVGYILVVSLCIGIVRQPEGEYIRLQDARILAEALWEENADSIDERNAAGDALLTYGQFLTLVQEISVKKGSGEWKDEQGNVIGDLTKWCEKEYKGKYKEEMYVLKEDWYSFYERLLIAYEMNSEIMLVTSVVLGSGEEVTDQDGNTFGSREMLTEEGAFSFRSDSFLQYKYQTVKAYRKDDVFLTVYEPVSRGYQLVNAWIMEAREKQLRVFLKGYEVKIAYERAEESAREQVADLEFADGKLQSVTVKEEKLSGKLLSVSEEGIEIEGYGKYPVRDGMKIYKLYGKLEEWEQKDLSIGYNFTDFVLEDGSICAGLVTRQEAMENIRIVIKNTSFTNAYHQKVELTADTDFVITYGDYKEPKKQEYKAGEKVLIEEGSEYLGGERIYVEPLALTGRIRLLSVERSQGTPSYRGKMEITKAPDGFVIVNEVLLEEYLYSVVPSEMPASYPIEALKAQAVCARTYAYRHMLSSGIARFGAHVDDSAGYQVYNNISEHADTTKAVKETTGQLLYYGESLCGSYYYSTSCGFGADSNIWKSDTPEDLSYLVPVRIGREEGTYTGEAMMDEDTFSSFIGQTFDSDYEREEAWYRWNYEVTKIDTEKILSILQKRYEANEKLILTKEKSGSFVAQPVKKLGDIKNIYIEKRTSGGAADELIIEGTKNTYKVISEHNIRYVLNDGESMVVRQDGSQIASPTLLPSAYMVLTIGKEDGIVVGYSLIGGGYGHGVGMSQNGAKAMANAGLDAKEILSFFYQSCEIQNAYDISSD